MLLSKEELRNQLKRRELAPFYVLFGAETHLRDLAARTIADLSFNPEDFRDFNETSFSLNNPTALSAALAAAEQLPMMSAKRVVRITDVRISATGYRDTITEEHEPSLAAYLQNPAPQAVIIAIADELNGVRKMGKFLREHATAVEFTRLDDAQLREWAFKELSTIGASADEAAIRHLVARIGPDVTKLTNEVHKLAAAALPNGIITVELIDELVAHSRELTNFELTDHLVAGRGARALAALRKVLDDGAEPLALLGLISYNYRRLLMAKDLMSRGAERSAVASTLKLRYNDQEPFLAAARRAETSRLKRAIVLLSEADLAIKTSIGGSGPAGARMKLEILVCELAAADQRAAAPAARL